MQKNTIQKTLTSSLTAGVTGSVGFWRLMTGAILQDERRHEQVRFYVVEEINDGEE